MKFVCLGSMLLECQIQSHYSFHHHSTCLMSVSSTGRNFLLKQQHDAGIISQQLSVNHRTVNLISFTVDLQMLYSAITVRFTVQTVFQNKNTH